MEKGGILRARIYGSFQLENDVGVLRERDIRSAKMMKFLVYMLINKEKVISLQNYIDIFWEDDSRNPAGVLKTLIYRLRQILRALGEQEFICTLPGGGYQWNPKVEMITDYEELKEKSAEVWAEPDVHRRELLCQEILEEYEENVSPALQEETWMMARVSGYRSLYMDVLETLCGIYDVEGRWAEMEELCRKGLAVDFFVENVHCWMIKSLQMQMKHGMARNHYKKVKKMYYENLGVQNVEKIQNALNGNYHGAFGGIRTETNIGNLMEDLDEKGRSSGALICEYPVFQQIYHMEQRRLARKEISKCIVLFTLKRRNTYGEAADAEGIRDSARLLEESMRGCLRLGDLVTRYSANQFIAFLTSCNYADGERVANRIVSRYESTRQGEAKKYDVEFVLELVKAESAY